MTTRSVGRAAAYCVAAALGVAIAGNHDARADLITTSPGLPPYGGTYMTATQVHATYPNVEISFVQHTGFNVTSLVQGATGPMGTGEQENFTSVLTGVVTNLFGGPTNIPFTLTGPVSVIAYGRTSDSETGTFVTQMLSMDLTGNINGTPVEIMLDPGNPTLGSTTITDIGNGYFAINSFFDVFTELSLDHGPFVPQTDAGGTVVTLQPGVVPEPSTMIMCIGAGLAVPFYAWRRRKPKQVE